MRIALATDWFAPRLGGIETQLAQLAEGLGDRGHRVDVLTTTPRAVNGVWYRVRAIEAARLPGLDLAISPRLVPRLREQLRDGYDVMHAHVSVVSPVAYAAVIAARTLGVPTVVTFHSVLRAKRLLLRLAAAVGGALRDEVRWTAVSELVAEQARAALGTAVDVLPNGVHLRWWKTDRQGADSHEVRLVSTLRLHRKKRPLQLLRSFLLAARDCPVPMRLVLVGVGPLAPAVRDEIDRAGNGMVELRGRLAPEELRALYGVSDGFVSASRREAFGIAALEALAAGLPVIAMREAGSSEFLVHEANALLCRNDDEISAAIARFASDAALRRHLSRPTPLERYDWRSVLAAHEATYERLTPSTRAGRSPAAARA